MECWVVLHWNKEWASPGVDLSGHMEGEWDGLMEAGCSV